MFAGTLRDKHEEMNKARELTSAGGADQNGDFLSKVCRQQVLCEEVDGPDDPLNTSCL